MRPGRGDPTWQQAQDLVDLFIETNHLPRAGGWLDQPVWWESAYRFFKLLRMLKDAPGETAAPGSIQSDWQKDQGAVTMKRGR